MLHMIYDDICHILHMVWKTCSISSKQVEYLVIEAEGLHLSTKPTDLLQNGSYGKCDILHLHILDLVSIDLKPC